MTKIQFLFTFMICTLLASSCTNDLPEQGLGDNPIDKNSSGLYILSSGGNGKNNSCLSFYDFRQGKFTSTTDAAGNLSYDYFTQMNQRKLGDNPNDLQQYGSKLYCPVAGAGVIEVIDINTGKSKQISMLTPEGLNKKPRRVAFFKNKAYVCNFDGTLAQIDTTSLVVEKLINVGRNPDAICSTNGKIYVANSGGMDQKNLDNTISVINPATFTETKKIIVRENMSNLAVDDKGNLFATSLSAYSSAINGYDIKLHKIDTNTDQVTTTYDYPAYNFVISGHTLYMYNYGDKNIKLVDTYTGKIINNGFITDGTIVTTPYCLTVSAKTGEVFVSDALDYKVNGLVYCFDSTGKMKYKLIAASPMPNAILIK